eukprot:scaffold1606_cov317-Prasinococcus_capsulatus_cf.AAC.2
MPFSSPHDVDNVARAGRRLLSARVRTQPRSIPSARVRNARRSRGASPPTDASVRQRGQWLCRDHHRRPCGGPWLVPGSRRRSNERPATLT